MSYKLPVTIKKINDNEFMARCEPVRAIATGHTPEEALNNLRESIQELIEAFGEQKVFQDIDANDDVRILEVSL
ncbi:hypothetical protein F9B85_10230 [Heliorestis acidaminivorans]|uniref:Type II toxin-antitoxin system HicB family antitoxin n=1 Tax=Heliorestis acidaminivorans TaxID=553427 RepID=A0A6I0ER26_9FIRM|nr:hypothetical protein [Heliorestis acidaminivorans]KAB2951926.1 hypothetical protein F9B85_10230 [Heliorestis acidaminivorans]